MMRDTPIRRSRVYCVKGDVVSLERQWNFGYVFFNALKTPQKISHKNITTAILVLLLTSILFGCKSTNATQDPETYKISITDLITLSQKSKQEISAYALSKKYNLTVENQIVDGFDCTIWGYISNEDNPHPIASRIEYYQSRTNKSTSITYLCTDEKQYYEGWNKLEDIGFVQKAENWHAKGENTKTFINEKTKVAVITDKQVEEREQVRVTAYSFTVMDLAVFNSIANSSK